MKLTHRFFVLAIALLFLVTALPSSAREPRVFYQGWGYQIFGITCKSKDEAVRIAQALAAKDYPAVDAFIGELGSENTTCKLEGHLWEMRKPLDPVPSDKGPINIIEVKDFVGTSYLISSGTVIARPDFFAQNKDGSSDPFFVIVTFIRP